MLAIIGALTLSETALELERASKNDEIDYCTQNFGEFKEKLLSLHKQLSAIFHDDSESSAKLSKDSKEEKANADNLPEDDQKAPASGCGAEKKPLTTRKVLLVDDTVMVQYVIKEKLLSYGLQVDTVASGFEAIDKIKNNSGKAGSSGKAGQYDFVFMDYKMPKMNGLETTQEIRKWEQETGVPEGSRLPIIALTANIESGKGEFYLANGFTGFLSKPVINEKLEEIIGLR